MKKNDNLITYNYEKNYFKIVNEAYGIIAQRKKHIKKPLAKKHTYIFVILSTILKSILIYFGLSLIIVMAEDILKLETVYSILGFITAYLFVLTFYLIFKTIFIYLKTIYIMHKSDKLNILINENGITDYAIDMDIQIFCAWDKIKRIVLTKNSIVILTNEKKLNFTLPKEEKIIEKLKKYKEDLFITKI